jgi:hypothetical protein
MDAFTKGQLHRIGIGGINCTCCNNKARRGKDKVDKKLNRTARARVKVETGKILKESL